MPQTQKFNKDQQNDIKSLQKMSIPDDKNLIQSIYVNVLNIKKLPLEIMTIIVDIILDMQTLDILNDEEKKERDIILNSKNSKGEKITIHSLKYREWRTMTRETKKDLKDAIQLLKETLNQLLNLIKSINITDEIILYNRPYYDYDFNLDQLQKEIEKCKKK